MPSPPSSWCSTRGTRTKPRERRGHVALVYTLSGVSLILSVLTREHFWLSYAFMCLAIPGPFAALAPFWAIPTETLPRNVFGPVIGLVNALGNTGGFAGPYIVGWLKTEYHSTADPVQRAGNRHVVRRRAGVFAAEGQGADPNVAGFPSLPAGSRRCECNESRFDTTTKSGGERAALQTLRDIRASHSSREASGVRWLQHRFDHDRKKAV